MGSGGGRATRYGPAPRGQSLGARAQANSPRCSVPSITWFSMRSLAVTAGHDVGQEVAGGAPGGLASAGPPA
jgi:hypothetical protein